MTNDKYHRCVLGFRKEIKVLIRTAKFKYVNNKLKEANGDMKKIGK